MEIVFKRIRDIIFLLVFSGCIVRSVTRNFEVHKSCVNEYKGTVCKNVESHLADQAVIITNYNEQSRHKEVTFEDSKLSLIPGNLFKAFKDLERLDLRNCGVVYIRISNFQNSTSLKFLDLSSNKIAALPSEVFMFVPTLVHLCLSDNKVSSLEWDTFISLSSLERLHLNGNRITRLPRELFKPLSSLQQLFLQNNQIEAIEKEMFENNLLLEKVDLRNNQIKVIERDSLTHLKALKWLDVSNNMFEELETGSLVELHANRAGIKTCQIMGSICYLYGSNNRLLNLSIYDVSRTELVHLRNNLLSDINAMSKASELRDLDISHNPIGELALNAFSNLSKLEHLNLSTINIKELHEDTFQSQTQLETLDLSGNSLERINLNAIKHMKNLRGLYIAANQIQVFDYHRIKEFLPWLREIDISQNSLNCSALPEILDYLQAHNIHPRGIENNSADCSNSVSIPIGMETSRNDVSLEVMSSDICPSVNESINAILNPIREEISEIKAILSTLKNSYDDSKVDPILETNYRQDGGLIILQ